MKFFYYILFFILCAGFAACDNSENEDWDYTGSMPSVFPKGQIDILNIDGNYIRVGNKKTGAVLYTIDGDYIRAGEGLDGDIVYTIDRYYIRAGEGTKGPIIYNFDGKSIRPLRDGSMYRFLELNGENISTVWSVYGMINDYNKIYNMSLNSDGKLLRLIEFRSGHTISRNSELYYIEFQYDTGRDGAYLLGAFAYIWGEKNKRIYTIKFNNTTLHPTSAKIYAGDGPSSPTAKPIYSMTISYKGAIPEEATVYAGSEISSNSYLYTILFDSDGKNARFFSYY